MVWLLTLICGRTGETYSGDDMETLIIWSSFYLSSHTFCRSISCLACRVGVCGKVMEIMCVCVCVCATLLVAARGFDLWEYHGTYAIRKLMVGYSAMSRWKDTHTHTNTHTHTQTHTHTHTNLEICCHNPPDPTWVSGSEICKLPFFRF
jgi:hypothetical protein